MSVSNKTFSALVIGADSTIGHALLQHLERLQWSVFSTTRHMDRVRKDSQYFLDLTDVQHFHFEEPVDVVYLCAAFTSLAECRHHPLLSEVVNVNAPCELARKLLPLCRTLVFLSSSAVFNGKMEKPTETETKSPVTVYGKHKAAAEDALLTMSNKVAVARLTKVLTPQYSLIRRWLQQLSQSECIEPFSDLNICPIGVDRVVTCLQLIGEQSMTGVIHLSGEYEITYQELAEYLIRRRGFSITQLKPRSALAAGLAASEVPDHTRLDMNASNQRFALEPMRYQTLIDRFYGDGL